MANGAFRMLPISPPVAALTEFPVKDGDVFVCSWPKSGTTWTQAIVAHLLAPDTSSWSHVSEITPFFDTSASFAPGFKAPAVPFKRRRAWNTHLLWSLIPKCAGVRYVYVSREAEDAVVSFYHHLRNQRGDAGQFSGSLDDFVRKSVVERDMPYGTWAEHLADWSRALSDDRVLFVRYEDMLADLASVVRDIANHLGVPFRQECVDKCRFAEMRRDEERYQPKSVSWAPGFHFLRQGKKGDGVATMSEKALELMDGDLRAHYAAVAKVRKRPAASPIGKDRKKSSLGGDIEEQQPLVDNTSHPTNIIIDEIV